MALLTQSRVWPIVRARDLHDQAQLGYLWQFYVPGFGTGFNEDMMMLAKTCTIPGIEFASTEYNVGGQVRYNLGKAMRGGQITASFLEIEGGAVDLFFRNWADVTDPLTPGALAFGRSRTPIGRGDSVTGHARTLIVRLLRRNSAVGYSFELRKTKLVKLGGPNLTYETSGALLVNVTMVCDEVVRGA